jgi:hypothetical protein
MIESISNKQEASNKVKTRKENQKSYSENRKIYPRQQCQKCCCLIHTLGHVEEIFNPLGVALGASLESGSCHLTLDSSLG